jgi:hypothetical protein
MMRSTVVLTVLACAVAASGDEKDKDPAKEKLFAAKAAYDAEMKQFRNEAGEWFNKREKAARKAGDKKALDLIKEERKSFDEDGALPRSAPVALHQKPLLARKALEGVYTQAVKDYVRAKKDDQAAAVEKEWEGLARASAIHLLPLVDTKAHAVVGEWKRDGRAIVGRGASEKRAQIKLPYELGEEYDIEVTCRRVGGDDAISVGLPLGGGRAVLVNIDGWPGRGYATGFEFIDKKQSSDNVATAKGRLLNNDVDYPIRCSVRSGKIEVFVDGKLITSFKGDFARLSLFDEYRLPNDKVPFLIVSPKTTYRIDRITVATVKGSGKVLK